METICTNITDYLLNQSWQIAFLFGVVAGASFALRKKTAHLRYLLWLLILAKCLVPSLITVSLAVLPQRPESLPLVESAAIPEFVPDSEPVILSPGAPGKNLSPPAPLPVRQRSIMARLAQIRPKTWFSIIWLGGVSLFLIIVLIKAVRFNHRLGKERKPLSTGMQKEIDELLGRFGIPATPNIWLLDGIGQPFVWGLVRGSIYLPANFGQIGSREHRRGILMHEIAHTVRFDAAVNLLQTIAQAIFWFHPLVWLANRNIRTEREKCCDETAIAKLSAAPKVYSSAIVDTLIAEYQSTQPIPSLAIAGPIKNIEDRIKTIMKPGKKFYNRPTIIAIITVFALAIAAVPTTIALTHRQPEKPYPLKVKDIKKPDVQVEDGGVKPNSSLESKVNEPADKYNQLLEPLNKQHQELEKELEALRDAYDDTEHLAGVRLTVSNAELETVGWLRKRYVASGVVRCEMPNQLLMQAETAIWPDSFEVHTARAASYLKDRDFLQEVVRRDKVRRTKWFQARKKDMEKVIDSLADSLTVHVKDTADIEVKFTAADPGDAQTILDELLQLFIRRMTDQAQNELTKKMADLHEEKRKLKGSIVFLEGEKQTLQKKAQETQTPDVQVGGEDKEAGYAVTGRVLTSPGGEAAAGAIVNLWHSGGDKSHTTETDTDGIYIFKNVKPSQFEYVLRIKNPAGIWTDWNIIHVSDKNIGDKDLYLTLPQSVSGIVRDVETSEPVSGAAIRISTDDGRNADSMRTDVDGKFRLYVSQRKVTVRCEGTEDRYYPNEESKKKLEVQPGQNINDIEFTVISAPKFTGQVLYPNGRPAENIRVDVSLFWSGGKNVPVSFKEAFGFGRTFHLKSDTEGRFIGYLRRPEGMRDWHPNITLKAVAWVPDHSLGGVTHAETKTDTRDVVSMKIILEKAGSATIRVINPDGKPIEYAKVTASSEILLLTTSDTKPDFEYPHFSGPVKYLGDGQYYMTNLIPGLDYYVAAQAFGYQYRPSKAKKFVLEPGEDFDAGTITLDWWGKKAVPSLVKQLHSPDMYDREGAARLLGSLGEDAIDSIPVLVELLRNDPHNTVRYTVAEALGKMGPLAKEAVPDLIVALEQDEGGGVKREAAKALGLIGDLTAVPALNTAMKDKDRDVRKAAAKAIKQIEEANKTDVQVDVAKWSEGKAMMGTIATGIRAWVTENYVEGTWDNDSLTLSDLGFMPGDLRGTYFDKKNFYWDVSFNPGDLWDASFSSGLNNLKFTILAIAPKGITKPAAVMLDQSGKWTMHETLPTKAIAESAEKMRALAESAEKLKELGEALYMYELEHENKLPDSLEELRPYDVDEELVWARQNVEYLGKGKNAATERAMLVIAFDKTLLKKKEGTNILFNDHHVQFYPPEWLKDIGVSPDWKEKAQIAIESRFILVPQDSQQLKDFFEEEGIELPARELKEWEDNSITAPADSEEIEKFIEAQESAQAETDAERTRLLDPDQVVTLLKLTQTIPESKLLTAPKALVFDGESAVLSIMQDVAYISGYTESDFDSEPQPITETIEKGVTLEVVPKITDDQNIKLDLDIELTGIAGYEERTYKYKSYEVPNIEVTKIVIEALIPDARTLLLAGNTIKSAILDSDDDSDAAETTKELLILITPTIQEPYALQDLTHTIASSWNEAFNEAMSVMDTRKSWPATPEALTKAFWRARAAKNYEEMKVLWPGSGSWNWPEICRNDPPVNYVFGPADKITSDVPYAAEEYFRKNHSYNLTMRISSEHTKKGKRYYIVSGN